MKPIAAIWHIPNTGQGAGDYPVAMLAVGLAGGLGVGQQALVVDVTGHLRNAPIDQLEIADPDVTLALTQAQARLTTTR